MIRTLLATTAIATLVATGAVAQTTAPTTDPAGAAPAQETPMVVRAEGHLASELIGESVYNGTGEEAENIGQVTDLIIDNEGGVEAIVVGVGGFLGIGQKEVALEYDLVQWSEQQDGDRWMVVETTEDALRAQEDFDRSAYRPMPADADVAETRPATADDLAAAPTQDAEGTDGAAGTTGGATAVAPADQGATGDTAAAPDEQATTGDTATAPADDAATTTDDTAAAPADDQAGGAVATAPAGGATTDQTAQTATGTDDTQTGAIDRSTLQQAAPDQISTDELTGTTVYGANEENIGDINDVILTPEGDVDAVIVDVGGFLGIGAKEVALGMDNRNFMTDENGDLYLFTEFTQEQLEAQPEYDEAAYTEQRDQMRLQAQ